MIPRDGSTIYGFSMRWADKWPHRTGNDRGAAEKDLGFHIIGEGFNPFSPTSNFFIHSEKVRQLSPDYAVKRGTQFSFLRHTGACLRIWVEPDSNGSYGKPGWVQFQVLVGGDGAFSTTGIASSRDSAGRSIGNPAESGNSALLAVGATNLRTPTPGILHYSSQGPVFASGSNYATRVKPDIVAGSVALTYTKWDADCNRDSTCGDDLYFGGTSGATAHTGGLAALTVQALTNPLGTRPSPTQVTGFMKQHAQDKGTRGPDHKWGAGFVKLPTLTPTPTPTPTPAACLPVSNYAAARLLPTTDYISWQNPTGGLRPVGRSTDVRKWIGDANGDWSTESIINARASATRSYNRDIDDDTYYAYRTRSRCVSGKVSGWTNWVITDPSDEARSASDDSPRLPTPTPVPADYVPPSGDDAGDGPPSLLTAPTNVTATGGAGTVTVTWTDGRAAVHHLVGLFTPDLKRRVSVVRATGGSHTFTGVAAGEYVAAVAAIDADSNYLYTVSDTVTVR